MKIHEVRNAPILESNSVDEGIGDLFRKKSDEFQPTKQQKKSAQDRESKVNQLTDRIYGMWRDRVDNIEKSLPPGKREAFLNRTDGRYRKELTDFIEKNLLNGQKISSMSNAEDINDFVDALAPAQVSGVQDPSQIQARPGPAAGSAFAPKPAAAPAQAAPAPTTRTTPAAAGTTVAPAPAAAGSAGTSAPARGAAAQPTEPAAVPEPKPPITTSRGGIERVSSDPLILRRHRTEYVLGDEGEWVKQGQKKAENESMQALLNQAAEEFENADTEYAEQMASYRQATGQELPAKKAAEPAKTAPAEPAQLMPGQTWQAPSPEQAAAEKETTAQAKAKQAADIQAAQAQAIKDREAADAADRARGIEPPSRGLIRKPGSSGRGMQAQFEPLAEAMDYKTERDLFNKLVRTALLSKTASGTTPGAVGRGQEVKATGNAAADQVLKQAGFTVT